MQAFDRKVLRLSFTISLTVFLSYLGGWPGYYIAPLFVSMILSADVSTLSLRQSIIFVVGAAILLMLGVLIGEFLTPYPFVCITVIFLFLVYGQYASVSGKPAVLVVLLFMGILMMPLLGIESVQLMHGMAQGILLSLALAVLMCMLAYTFLPVKTSIEEQAVDEPAPQLLPVQNRFNIALLKSLLCLPLFLLFYFYQLTSDLLVLIFVAILIQMPSAAVGLKGSAAMLLANVMGGVVAIILYQLIIIVPNIFFVSVCVFIAMISFGRRLFSDSPTASLYGTGINTILVLVGGTTNVGADDASDKLAVRLLQIFMAVVYIVVALNLVEKTLERFQKLDAQGPHDAE